MYKLRFLLAIYARSVYRRLALLLAAGAAITAAASFTAWAAPVAVVYALVVGGLAALAATLGVMVLNVVVAAAMQRGIMHFEAAYDAYRRANAIPDVFYEEMDLEDASRGTAAPAARTTI